MRLKWIKPKSKSEKRRVLNVRKIELPKLSLPTVGTFNWHATEVYFASIEL
jgi:hypothetical protein